MSMLSAQCDELRVMAESVGLTMPQAATLMMDAADAIDRLDAENARLREQIADACMQLGGAWVRCSELCDLVRDMVDYGEGAGSGMAEWFADRMHDLGIEVDE